MEENHLLVQRGELDNVLATLINKQQTVIADIEKCLPLIKDDDLEAKLLRQKSRAELQLKALQEGYVPIVGGWFWDIDTKSKWGEKAVRGVLETMPAEVKQVMEDAKASGTFEHVKVSGSRRGDPMLVGTTGRQNFLLAMWANLEGGYAIGFAMKHRKHTGVYKQ